MVAPGAPAGRPGAVAGAAGVAGATAPTGAAGGAGGCRGRRQRRACQPKRRPRRWRAVSCGALRCGEPGAGPPAPLQPSLCSCIVCSSVQTAAWRLQCRVGLCLRNAGLAEAFAQQLTSAAAAAGGEGSAGRQSTSQELQPTAHKACMNEGKTAASTTAAFAKLSRQDHPVRGNAAAGPGCRPSRSACLWAASHCCTVSHCCASVVRAAGCWVLLCRLLLCWVLLCWVLLCWVLLCWVLLCWVLLCWVLLCWVLPGQLQSAACCEAATLAGCKAAQRLESCRHTAAWPPPMQRSRVPPTHRRRIWQHRRRVGCWGQHKRRWRWRRIRLRPCIWRGRGRGLQPRRPGRLAGAKRRGRWRFGA
jgi:hypothetical protein